MRTLITFVIVVGGIVAGVWYLVENSKFDPDAQGEQAFTSIKPGMTWKKVVDVAGEPRNWQEVQIKKRSSGGIEWEEMELAVAGKYEASVVRRRIDDASLPDGFVFPYMFSARYAFSVWFDQDGYVTEVTKDRTAADLINR